MHHISIICRVLGLALACAMLGGCYILEGAAGQLSLLSKRVPIPRVTADPKTPAHVRSQLEAVSEIREFASRDLDLPDNGSYRSYADIGRPYVVWNVVAAPEFSLEPKKWCYPIVGCVAYRGYFVERRARRFADRWRRRGFDVSVEGVAAYSTLGHFDDPVLSSMLGWNDVELASIIFHELTHQMIYLPNDADFDEALAVTVEQEGVRRWLESQGRERDLERYRLNQRRFQAVLALLERARGELESLYGSGIEAGEMRRGKAAIFSQLALDYRDLEREWGGHAPFAAWFDGGLDNAELASIATYYDCVPGFERELEEAGRDLPAFYARVRALAKLDRQRRHDLLCGPA